MDNVAGTMRIIATDTTLLLILIGHFHCSFLDPPLCRERFLYVLA